MATAAPAPAPGHRRNKSSSVLKSIIIPRNHRRTPSDGAGLNGIPLASPPYMPSTAALHAPLLPPDHPHSQLRAANWTETVPLAAPPSPTKPGSPKKSFHKKSLSAVSLRSLGRDKSQDRQSAEARRARDEEAAAREKPVKTKSSTNLAAMFGKGRSRDSRQAPPKSPSKDKENASPPHTAYTLSPPPRAPIWAEFSSHALHDVTTSTKVPLNDQRRSVDDDPALYTPRNCSPAKQRNPDHHPQPAKQTRPAAKERPKSMIVSSKDAVDVLFGTFSRKKSHERAPLADTQGNEGRVKDTAASKAAHARPALARAKTDSLTKETMHRDRGLPQLPPPSPKKPNRVMAAVAAFNGRSKQVEGPPASPTKLNPSVVDADFEEVLESRNIPTHQRAQMRTLTLEVKADFVRTHKLDTAHASTTATTCTNPSVGEGKPGPARSSKSRNGSIEQDRDPLQADPSANASKRERPRSRTFTFNRSDSPTKKQRGEMNDKKASSKSNPIPKSPSTRSLVSNASERSVSSGAKSVKSDDFIAYLRKTPKPQDVEVGKLHKLRLLLRNETVDWVDTFIRDGGMTELVGLLHCIMEIEWRDDHDDTLLHELLRCLKGLCTTDSALKQLAEIASTLYPALLAMLFDEEHKGPSEFTTRELIIDIIFAHISMAPESELESRATELLKYLKDPIKEKESSTVPFVLQMHQPRPYQVWCKEMSNVTKEVFWIFIHHLNVIPVPPQSSLDGFPKSYAKTHFPGPRAIVPAAPYVGGVEWDATNYIATHIDLLNGLIASLPTRSARNELRQEFKVSGFEKLMGHLRACNPKYYGAVHDSVKVWIGAALEDDWDIKPVRMGPGDGKGSMSPLKQSPKKKVEQAPQLQAPKMDLGLGLGLGFDKEIDVGGCIGKKDDDWI
ncbi:GTPase binding protein-like protein Rid1 [Dothidotthia symphoricarpi CBS 119687]|uniref:GTPase binding protein-like protein Rid1 n=1 Tax=Dothidotthia symphoricarpi CBS 119687 TaxID=1392245 RepID=A0A6A6AEE7_9PLEO|nr:GTPase binding protein-like protein Rid1 [Dothidotthia symphoricarpi CBS 119687]KAF2130249.1 GTPase binding protein-like protein Rid1 [Dothidotthia symphoricarpi CBS 119687]